MNNGGERCAKLNEGKKKRRQLANENVAEAGAR